MTQKSEQRAATTEIRIGIGPALLLALTVVATFGAGFGVLHNETSSLREDMISQLESLRSDMREDHAAMREDIVELQVGVGRLDIRMDHLEQRLGSLDQRLGHVERILGIQLPGDSQETL